MEPEVIADAPIPLIDGSILAQSGYTNNDVVGDTTVVPQNIKDPAIPPAIIAQETISQALNTSTKSILANFTFESLGAIQIGQYTAGVSGQIRISPNGIVATNAQGVTTITIDGTTGNVTLIGTLQAGTIISGGVIQGGSININNAFTVDSSGNMVATSATISGYISTTGTGQTLSGSINTGNGNVLIDGANKRIIINDGSYDRVLIGYQSGGF